MWRSRAYSGKGAVVAAALWLGVSGAAEAQHWRPVNATAVVLANGNHISGRVNAAVADPRNADVMYIAADGGRPTGADGNPGGPAVLGLPDTGGGGIWKTENWTAPSPHWVALTDDQPSLSVGVNGLAMARTNPDVLYAVADAPRGSFLKTTDGGRHWKALGQAVFDRAKFGGVAVSPVDPWTVYVAVFRADGQLPGGVYKSEDGGHSWSLGGWPTGLASHVVIDPSAPNTVYAGYVDPDSPSRQGVWKSVDGGATWTSQTGNFPEFPGPPLYIEFAIAPSSSNIIYLVWMNKDGPQGTPRPKFYSTANGGETWALISPTSDDPDNRYWHQPLAVHPLTPNILFAEGLNHVGMISLTGGVPQMGMQPWLTWWTGDDPVAVMLYQSEPGSDQYQAVAVGDRGIYWVMNPVQAPGQFIHKQGNLSNLLLETIAVDPTDPNTLYGTAFDQLRGLSTSSGAGGFWQYFDIGSEFGKFLVDPSQTTTLYYLEPIGGEFGTASTFIRHSTDGGQHWSPFVTGIDASDFEFVRSMQTNPAAWKAFELDPSHPQRLLVGGKRVYQWVNSAGRWQPLGDRLTDPSSETDFISAINVAPAPSTAVYAATAAGGLFVNTTGTDWTSVSSLDLPAPGFVARIEINPNNASQLVVVVQEPTGAGRVWTSWDRGRTWRDITANLPSGLRAYTVAVDWRRARGRRPPGGRIYVGTDRGVFHTTLGASGWHRFGQGLPNTLVSDLRITPGVLTAATYGRGAWQVRLR